MYYFTQCGSSQLCSCSKWTSSFFFFFTRYFSFFLAFCTCRKYFKEIPKNPPMFSWTNLLTLTVFLPVVSFLVAPSLHPCLYWWSSPLIRYENAEVCVKGAVSCCSECHQFSRSEQVWDSWRRGDKHCPTSGWHIVTLTLKHHCLWTAFWKKFSKIVSASFSSNASPYLCSEYPKGFNENSSILLKFTSIFLQCLCTRYKTKGNESPYIFFSLSPRSMPFKLCQWILKKITHKFLRMVGHLWVSVGTLTLHTL